MKEIITLLYLLTSAHYILTLRRLLNTPPFYQCNRIGKQANFPEGGCCCCSRGCYRVEDMEGGHY